MASHCKQRLSAVGLSAAVLCVAAPALAQDGVPRGESGAVKKDAPAGPAPADLSSPPRLLKFVQPVHPPEAKEKGLEGKVVVQLDIDKDGKVTGVVVVGPAGNGFDEAATTAA